MKQLILIISALLLASCSSLTINYDYDPHVDFTPYKTYRWGESDPEHDILETYKLLRNKIRVFSDSILAERGFVLVADTSQEVDFEIVVFGILKSDTSIVVDHGGPSVGVGFGGGGYGGYGGYGYRGYGYGGFAGPTGSYNASGDPARDGGYGHFGPVGGGHHGYPTAVAIGVGGETRAYLDVHQEGTIVFDIVNPKTKNLVWRSAAHKTVQEHNSAKEADALIKKVLTKVYANFPPPEMVKK